MRLITSFLCLFVVVKAYSFATPSCEELNDLYRNNYTNYDETTNKGFLIDWEGSDSWSLKKRALFELKFGEGTTYINKDFPCPVSSNFFGNENSEGRYAYFHLAKHLYMLDVIDVFDENGNETFDYFDYVSERVNYLLLSSRENTSAAPNGDGKSGDIYLNPSTFLISDLQFASAFFHEVIHFKGDDRDHQTCITGQFAGGLACDEYKGFENWETAGPYHADVYYFVDIYNNSHLTDQQKQVAKYYAYQALSNNFLNMPKGEIKRVLDLMPNPTR